MCYRYNSKYITIITEPGKNDHDAVCASLGYAMRDEMMRILRHCAKEVKEEEKIRRLSDWLI